MSKRLKIKTSYWYRNLNRDIQETLQNLTNDGEFPLAGVNQEARELEHNIVPHSSENYINNEQNDQYNLGSENVEHLYFDSGSESENDDICLTDLDLLQVPEKIDVVNRLKHWSVENQISHKSLGQLLEILIASDCPQFQSLPKDPRAFLQTPRSTEIRPVFPGNYCNIGIKNALSVQYFSQKMKPSNSVDISINIDGLPLAKSTSSQVYPILCINNSIQSSIKVCLIGIYHGYDKPQNFNEFLEDFVTEASDLVSNGIELFGITYNFKISSFLFDAVAKPSVLYIKGHNGYHSCTKCDQKGECVQDRMCFPNLKFKKRNHEEFLAQTDRNHHTGESILCKIPGIDLINDIPLDYMHLVLLGVVKKLVSGL